MDDSFCEKLIELVSDHPVLYDKSHSKYKDTNLKENVWSGIATELDSTEDIVMKKWKSLRDSYNRKLKENKAVKSGQAAGKLMVPYKFARQLEFLNKFISNRGTSSNFPEYEDFLETELTSVYTESDETNNGNGNVDYSPALEEATPVKDTEIDEMRPKMKRNRKESVADRVLDYLKSKRPKERNEDELFLLSLMPTFSRFSEYQKAVARMRIQQVLMDVEFATQPQSFSSTPEHFSNSPTSTQFYPQL